MGTARKSRDHQLDRARALYEQRAWGDAYEVFTLADRATRLSAEDLEQLALAAYLSGRDDEYASALERAHDAYVQAGHGGPAVRCAFWLGFRLLDRNELGRAAGWFARGERLLQHGDRDCAERGYLLLPLVEQRLASREFEAAYAAAADAVAIGERCGDADLVACARHQQGRIRLQQGQVKPGLALLDETMIAVTGGQLSPLVTGLMYCSVIQACQQVYATDRAREWSAALAKWCQGQPDMIAFRGVCQVHLAEVMQLEGAWLDAIDQARRACSRSQGVNQRAAAAAFYQQAEVFRLKGDFPAAEQAYRSANQLGLEPQPGLALLRLSQNRSDAAAAAIRRAAGVTTDPLKRLSLLPAYVEIVLALGDVADARKACGELAEIARTLDTAVPGAIAAQACGAVDLAEGNALAALASLRRAFEVWQSIEAPYAAARVRLLIGLSCRALGDEDTARLELEAARAVFERLGAVPDLARVDSPPPKAASARGHGLTQRELQVLRLVASGETNKSIAKKLALSEKTIDRHVSNILNKLDVPSRTAATALAYRHKLL